MRILATLACALVVAGCRGPYEELERYFSVDAEFEGTEIQARTVIMTGAHHSGAFALRDSVRVGLAPTFIDMRADFPFNVAFGPVRIPMDAISGCSMSCFGRDRWHADVLLGRRGIQLGFDLSSEVIDWCWENDLPMITGKDQREWMYSRGDLPSREGYIQVSRERYAELTESACRGY